jgi:hypothetical protein
MTAGLYRGIPTGLLLVGLFAVMPAQADSGSEETSFFNTGVVLRLGGGGYFFNQQAFIDTAEAWGFPQAGSSGGGNLAVGYKIMDWLEVYASFCPVGSMSRRRSDELAISVTPIYGGLHLVPYRSRWFTPSLTASAGAARVEVDLNEVGEEDWVLALTAGAEVELMLYQGLGLGFGYHYHHIPTGLKNRFGQTFDASGHQITATLILRI